MEWTEEMISRLRGLWQDGLSTAEIGRRMSITKNAVVGKAHRLTLTARPSPIRKTLVAVADSAHATRREPSRLLRASLAGGPAQVAQFQPRPVTQPEAGSVAHQPREGHDVTGSVTPLRAVRPAAMQSAAAGAGPVRAASSSQDPDADEPPVRHAPTASPIPMPSAGDQPAPRRRGQSCCWPLGDPGTKHFRFCGGEPIPNKPYCTEHAQLAYVKLRDRRETVA